MGYQIGIDIGGTFTDFLILDDHGDLRFDKELSTPPDPAEAVMGGLARLGNELEGSLSELLGKTDAIVHGTTIADNTLIQGSGAVTGLLATDGFRDEMAMRRGYKEDIWDVRLPAPPEIVPRRRRLPVNERIAADGSVIEALDEESVRRAARRLRLQGVESVAVVTLFSFLNPVHEQRIGEIVAEELPDAELSLSHEIMPKAPEFERTSTTVVNAYVGPRVTGYLDRLSARLREDGYERGLLVMQSGGGVMSRDYVQRRPVSVLASGPAGGVIACAAWGRAKGEVNVLCVDMGGTSYDVSVVRNGMAPAESGWNWHHRYLVGLPMVAVTTLGAGGGSIANVVGGLVEVGPQSAGADPGPVCYGRGGDRPTVTDANLVLGLLSSTATFAGGRFSLGHNGVREAIDAHVAQPLGTSVEEAAFDIWRVVNANMSQAVRRVTADTGVNPSSLVMVAYGGNGPVHACKQAEHLGIERILIPRASPAFSALGLLAADPQIDEEKSYLAPSADVELARVADLWSQLSLSAARYFSDAGFPIADLRFSYRLNLRYPGQNWSLSVPVQETSGTADCDFLDPGGFETSVKDFHVLHEQEHTYARRDQEPELTGVRVVTSTEVRHPDFEGGIEADPHHPEPQTTRAVNMGAGYADTPIFDGLRLRPGDIVTGPGIIEESFTTIAVYPDWEATVDPRGDYVVHR